MQVQSPPDEATRKKMRAVRQAGTKPEIAVRVALDALGINHDVNVGSKPGRPDIWVTDMDNPLFVHGCYWHRHEGCKASTTPKKNREFWLAKFKKNQERDAKIVSQLEGLGYRPITIWECETRSANLLRQTIASRVGINEN